MAHAGGASAHDSPAIAGRAVFTAFCTATRDFITVLFMIDFMILLVAGLVAGAMNAAAGGGSFVTFPAMVFAGLPSVEANASSTVALFPGALASVYAYRHDFRPFEILSLPVMLAVTMVGGFVGALLLLVTPAKRFDMIVPWLLLTGTLVFAFGGRASVWLRRVVRIGPLDVALQPVLAGDLLRIFRRCRRHHDAGGLEPAGHDRHHGR